MLVQPESAEDIVTLTAHRFNTFGGGKRVEGNPLASAMIDSEPAFFAGVSVKDVVMFVIEQAAKLKPAATSSDESERRNQSRHGFMTGLPE